MLENVRAFLLAGSHVIILFSAVFLLGTQFASFSPYLLITQIISLAMTIGYFLIFKKKKNVFFSFLSILYLALSFKNLFEKDIIYISAEGILNTFLLVFSGFMLPVLFAVYLMHLLVTLGGKMKIIPLAIGGVSLGLAVLFDYSSIVRFIAPIFSKLFFIVVGGFAILHISYLWDDKECFLYTRAKSS